MAITSYNPSGARPVKRKSPVEEVLATPAAVPTPEMATPPLPQTVKPVAPVDPVKGVISTSGPKLQQKPALIDKGIVDVPMMTPEQYQQRVDAAKAAGSQNAYGSYEQYKQDFTARQSTRTALPSQEGVVAAAAGPGPTDPIVTTPDLGTDWEDWETDPAIGGPPNKIHYTTLDLPPSQWADQNVPAKLYDAPSWLSAEDKAKWERQNAVIKSMIENYTLAQQQGLPIIDVTNEFDSIGFEINPETIRHFIQEQQRQQKDLVKTSIVPGRGTNLPDVPGTTPTPDQPTTVPTTTAKDSLAGGTQPPVGSAANYEKYKNDPSQHPEGMAGFLRDRNAARAAGMDTSGGGATPDTGGTTTTPTTTSNPAQGELDAFLQTDPTQHPEGMAGWLKERNRLRDKVAATTTKTTVTEGDTIKSDEITSSIVDPFLEKLIKDGYELSSEEEATIRRNVDTAMRSALSGLSARGLGRSSEAVGAIVQGEIAKEQQVGEARARVRKEGTEAGLAASKLIRDAQELNLNKTVADRNYQLAVRDQNLNALKNEQDVSFQDRALQLKEMESAAAIKQMEREFGLKIDAQAWEQFKQGKELDFTAIDLDQTNTFRNAQLAQDYLLRTRDQDIEENLGLTRLEIEKAIQEERIDLEKVQLAMERMFKNLDVSVERDKIRAALLAADQDGDLFTKFLGVIGTAAMFV